MREHVRTFAEEAAAVLPISGPIVEIGARPAEGQEAQTNLRSIFAGHDYLGCDIQPGPGVDRVEDVHRLTFEDDSVGTVLSFDTLEHVADPLQALREIHRVLRPGGVAVISSVMFFPIHAHPWDYWRFTPEGFELLLAPFESKLVLAQGFHLLPETVLGVGVKGPFELSPSLFPKSKHLADTWANGRHVDFGPIRLTTRELWKITLKESVAAARRRLGR